MNSRLFVVMPYGEREGLLDHKDPGSQCKIDFDGVWNALVSPAVPDGFTAKRADELREPGLIDQLYNEWLLDSDVVLADITFGNPNVFYELGIRQALSQKGTILIAQARSRLPFDVHGQFVLSYDYFKAPSIPKFQKDLRDAILNAAESERRSPVHTYLPGLFVGRFNPGENPDIVIANLRKRISELEKLVMEGSAHADAERLCRRVETATEAAHLVGLYHQILAFSAPSLNLLATAAIKLRKFGLIEPAINLLSLARERWPEDAEVLRELGFCFRKRGPEGFGKAQELFEQALRINEGDPELHGMLGGMLKRVGKYDEAYQHYRRAYDLLPQNLYALVNLAILEAIRGDGEAAGRFYREVIFITESTRAEGDYWHFLCRGEAAVFLGQDQIAFSAYESALNLMPPVEDVRSAAEQLEYFLTKVIPSDVAKASLRMLEEYLAWKAPSQSLKLTGTDPLSQAPANSPSVPPLT